MSFNEAKFILSAPKLEFCPPEEYPEICFAGRSNVGKSSLINALTNRKKLAKTSNVPGKTQEMNYYFIHNKWYLVDLPGYGFAKVSKKERARWGEEIRRYLVNRKTLHMVALILDLRHAPSKLDIEFMMWMAEKQIPFSVFASKADKLSTNQQQKALNIIKVAIRKLDIEVPIIPFSIMSKNGLDEVQDLLEEFLTLPPEPENI